MAQNAYDRFCKSELILRDELALERTVLAAERTLLAYLRSAMTLVLAGLTFLHFGTGGLLTVMGWACLPLGVATGVLGYIRWRTVSRSIAALRRAVPPGTGNQ